MTNAITVAGILDHGVYKTYVNNAKYQPIDAIYASVYTTANPSFLQQTIPKPPDSPLPPGTNFIYVPKTVVKYICYKLALRSPPGTYPFYIKNSVIIECPYEDRFLFNGLPPLTPQEAHPGGTLGYLGDGTPVWTGGDEYFPYIYYSYVSEWYLKQQVESTFYALEKPSYKSLMGGYYADPRQVPQSLPRVIPTVTETVTIGYYRQNTTEPLGQSPANEPNLFSLDWTVYTIDLVKGKLQYLPIENCLFGSLYVIEGSNQISDLIAALPVQNNQYSYSVYTNGSIDSLFLEWNAIANTITLNLPANFTQTSSFNTVETARQLNVIYANNNVWNNDPSTPSDINPSRFPVISDRQAYDWHLKPQPDGSFGDLVMNSPLLENIGRAVDAGKWGVNIDNPDLPRVDNLGWRTNRICEVLGIRVKSDGTIDEALEKTTNRRLHVEGSAQNDLQKNNPNCFGSETMLVRYLPNKFSPNGTVAGGYRKVRDIPQLLAELHEQANAAMGYQEGTAIEIQVDGQTYRYPNQLALMTEIFVTLKQSAVYSKGAFFSSVVGEQSIKEVISGLGLRTVDKYLEFKVAGKIVKLYYKGVSASQSIRRKMSAIATNIGTVIGNIT